MRAVKNKIYSNLQRGFAVSSTVIVVAVLLVGGVIAISRPWETSIDKLSTDPKVAVEQILDKLCPTKEELVLALSLAEKIGDQDLVDRVKAKKISPICKLNIGGRSTLSDSNQNSSLPDECVIRDSWDIWGEEWNCRTCYTVYDTSKYNDKSATYDEAVIEEEKCEQTVGVAACDVMEARLDAIDCLGLVDIPVGFEDQFDFSDYQTDELDDLPIEPIPESETEEPEIVDMEIEPIDDASLWEKGLRFFENPIEVLFGR